MLNFFAKYPRLGRLFDMLLPLLATLAALGVGAIMLQLLGANPVTAYGALLQGAFGSQIALADTIVRATPLLLVALGICIAFRAGVINIGGEGQLVAGAILGTLVGLMFPEAPGIVIVRIAKGIELDVRVHQPQLALVHPTKGVVDLGSTGPDGLHFRPLQ